MTEPRLIAHLVRQFTLRWEGIHGLRHWARVRENGLHLAEATGARRDVVELFALFHDSRRWNEGGDPDHGPRGAELARELHGRLYDVDDEGLELLALACRDHSRGRTEGDVTVQTCWDADRLDLPRVGLTVRKRHLCTAAAKGAAVIAWAEARAVKNVAPPEARRWEGLARELGAAGVEPPPAPAEPEAEARGLRAMLRRLRR